MPYSSAGEQKIDVEVAGQKTGTLPAPSDTSANAASKRPAISSATELGIIMPTPTIKPLLAAFSLGGVFIGLIMHKNLPIMFLAAACFVLSLYNWLLSPLEPEHH